MSCPNATVSAAQDQLSAAIRSGDDEGLAILSADPSLIHACDRDGGTPLHAAATECSERLVEARGDRLAPPRPGRSMIWRILH